MHELAQTSRRTAWLLTGLFFLALAIRLININVSSLGPNEIHDDAVDYHLYAVNLLESSRYIDGNGERAVRMPGYPGFLAAVYALFGQSVLAVQIVQSILNALACVLIFFAARPLVSEVWALTGGFVAAVYFDFFTGSARILSESVYLFALTLFLVLWLSPKEKGRLQAYGLGVLLGVAMLFRPEALFFGAVAGLFVSREGIRRRLLLAGVFWLGMASALTPWIIRNYVVLNAWVPLTTRAGASAYVGLQWHMSRLGQMDETFEKLSPSEVEDGKLYTQKAKDLYKKTPITLILKSMIYNFSVFVYPMHPGLDPTLVFLAPFWILGAFFIVTGKARDIRLVLFMGTFMLAYVFFGATAARYREPLAAGTVLLAVIGFMKLYERIGRRPFVAALATWALVTIALLHNDQNVRHLVLTLRDRLW